MQLTLEAILSPLIKIPHVISLVVHALPMWFEEGLHYTPCDPKNTFALPIRLPKTESPSMNVHPAMALHHWMSVFTVVTRANVLVIVNPCWPQKNKHLTRSEKKLECFLIPNAKCDIREITDRSNFVRIKSPHALAVVWLNTRLHLKTYLG